MAQEPHFDPNLRQNCALSLPQSHILTPNLHQSCAKADQCHPQGLALILQGVGGSERYIYIYMTLSHWLLYLVSPILGVNLIIHLLLKRASEDRGLPIELPIWKQMRKPYIYIYI